MRGKANSVEWLPTMPELLFKPTDWEGEVPCQVSIEYRVKEDAELFRTWWAWLITHGCEPREPFRENPSGTIRSSFCWITDPDVEFAYRLRWT